MTKIIAFDRARRTRQAEQASQMRRQGGKTGGAEAASQGAGASATERRACGLRRMRDHPVHIAISVVVPTRGRPELLNRCMASLALQRFDPRQFEIIIVDDGPSDETREVVSSWAGHCAVTGPQITYIPSMGPHGPAAARNHGWRAARGEIVAFTDDDTVARADWLRNGLRAFEGDVDAVWGRILMPLSGTPTDYELDAKNLERAEFVTANCFCRKAVLVELGGFDERFRLAWREDADLYFRLIQHCANIVHAPEAVMMHPIRPAGWGVSLSQVKKVQFDALLYKKHPTLYRHKIRPAPRWDFYLTVSALVIAIAAALLGILPLVLIAGTTWVLATGYFCYERLRKTSKAPLHIAEMVVTSALIPPLALFWRVVGMLKFRTALL
jgi:GT2 family glycosyltransferase